MAKKKRKKLGKELPETFVARLAEMYGRSVFDELKKSFVERPTSFRVNGIKAQEQKSIKTLEESGFRLKRVPWYSDAFLLQHKTKRELTEMALYTDGKIYIQSLASMIPPLVLDPQSNETVLDLAAAPGSKTSQIAGMMDRQGTLIACDVNPVRIQRLNANMAMLGVSETKEGWHFETRLTDGSVFTKQWDGPLFDKILVDAICSAEARFRDGVPKSYGYWSEHKIKEVSYRQHKLLMAAWSVLKPGGVLVYSTCTMAPEENESRISKLLSRHPDAEVLPIDIAGLKRLSPLVSWRGKDFHPEVKHCLRIFPTNEIEGFFVAKVRKKAENVQS